MDLFITCGAHLELLLAQELATLGYPQAIKGFRGVFLDGVDLEAIYRINYCSRIAGRVLLALSRFHVRDSKQIYSEASKLDWSANIPRGKSIAVDAHVNHPALRNSLYAAQTVKDAICDQLRKRYGWRPEVNPSMPDVQINLFVNNGKGVISLDTSGQSLHKRGYRLETVAAPMQETLAAALLTIANFQGTEIFYDPCCGSGTLLIEAALIAGHVPPGFLRQQWGFMHLPDHSQELWLRVKAEADSKRREIPEGQFSGTDINKQAVHACQVNLRAAGFHRQIKVACCDFRDYEPVIFPTIVVSNPPHGGRLDSVEQLRPLYRSLGDWMKRKTRKPGKGAILTNLELSKEIGLAPLRRHVIKNGADEYRFLEFHLF